MSDKTIADKMYLKTAKSLALFNATANPGVVAQLPQDMMADDDAEADVERAKCTEPAGTPASAGKGGEKP